MERTGARRHSRRSEAAGVALLALLRDHLLQQPAAVATELPALLAELSGPRRAPFLGSLLSGLRPINDERGLPH